MNNPVSLSALPVTAEGRAVGFLLAHGPPAVVRGLAWSSLPSKLGDTAVAARHWESRDHAATNSLVKGVQFSGTAASGALPLCEGTFLAGDVFGSRNRDSDRPLSWSAATALVREVWGREPRNLPYALDTNAALALAEPDGAGFAVFGDRAGWRRLFSYRQDGLTVVSTWLRALLRLVPRPWVVDTCGARMYLATREAKWPRSVVQDVETLPPVHRLTVRAGECQIESYWQSPSPVLPNGNPATGQDLVAALGRAVRRQVEGRRATLLLSGGYDSVFLAYLSRQAGIQCEALTGRVVGGGMDEAPYAARVCQILGIPHRIQDIAGPEVVKLQRELASFLDIPGHDPTNMTLMSRVAARLGYEVLLQGMGGDALFGNAASYHRLQRSWRVAQVPGAPRLLASFMRHARRLLGRPAGAEPDPLALTSARPADLYTHFFRSRVLRPFSAFLADGFAEELRQTIAARAPVFEAARRGCSSDRPWQFAWSVWDNPDEYHAEYAATGCGLSPAMPFAEPSVLDVCFAMGSGAALSRADQARLVGMDEGLLLPRKQGFKIPFEAIGEEFRTLALDLGFSARVFTVLGLEPSALTKDLRPLGAGLRVSGSFRAAFLGRLVRLMGFTRDAGLGWSS